MKKILIVFLIICILFTNSSCKRRPILEDKNVEYKIGMVTDVGGVNDQSFNQSCFKGLKKYKEDHPNVRISYLDSKIDVDYAINLRLFAENNYDIIIGVGYATADAVREVALEYPDKQFAIIDDTSVNLPNVVGTSFAAEQAGYLVGIVAGMMTKTNIIGCIVGMDAKLVNLFYDGYVKGAKSVNENVEILYNNINSFLDSAAATTVAKVMISQDADIIFPVAGSAGIGAINCCVVNNVYAIGVDIDQSYLAPNNVLTSAMKRVDIAAYQVVDSIIKGDKIQLMVFDVSNGGIDIAPTKNLLPVEVIKKVEEAKQKLINGDIKIIE